MSGYARTAGERIGPYLLESPLGRGGFSEVWKARLESGPKQAVALKVLTHPEHVAQLRAEASALSVAKGEGILKVFAVDLTSDPPYLALELAEGDVRAELLRNGGKLAPTDAVLRIEQVLSVLARVHREGIVHGDLKPENVLRKGDTVCLADFGLSRRLSQRSASLSVSLSREDARLAGTLDYMAPEQREGEKPTTRSDVYALGVLLYEMLVGERPQGVFALPSEKDPAIPPVIDRVLACSLAHDPRQRFATAGALLAFLRQGLKNDWGELAKALRRIEVMQAGLRSQDALFVIVVSSLVLAFAVLHLLAKTVEIGPGIHVQRIAWSSERSLAPLLYGVPAACFLLSLLVLRPWLQAREGRLQRLQRKISQQIAARPTWQRARPVAGPLVGAHDRLRDLVRIKRELGPIRPPGSHD